MCKHNSIFIYKNCMFISLVLLSEYPVKFGIDQLYMKLKSNYNIK